MLSRTFPNSQFKGSFLFETVLFHLRRVIGLFPVLSYYIDDSFG